MLWSHTCHLIQRTAVRETKGPLGLYNQWCHFHLAQSLFRVLRALIDDVGFDKALDRVQIEGKQFLIRYQSIAYGSECHKLKESSLYSRWSCSSLFQECLLLCLSRQAINAYYSRSFTVPLSSCPAKPACCLMLTGGRRKQNPYNSVASPIGKYPFLRRIMAVQGSPLALKEPPFGALELKRTVRAST